MLALDPLSSDLFLEVWSTDSGVAKYLLVVEPIEPMLVILFGSELDSSFGEFERICCSSLNASSDASRY